MRAITKHTLFSSLYFKYIFLEAETLSMLRATYFVTGHTVVADTISAHYNGKVINIDTPHKSGKSEALLLKKGKFYRVDMNGEKALLFNKGD